MVYSFGGQARRTVVILGEPAAAEISAVGPLASRVFPRSWVRNVGQTRLRGPAFEGFSGLPLGVAEG